MLVFLLGVYNQCITARDGVLQGRWQMPATLAYTANETRGWEPRPTD